MNIAVGATFSKVLLSEASADAKAVLSSARFVTLSLSYDEREMDAEQGARFLQAVHDMVMDPVSMLN